MDKNITFTRKPPGGLNLEEQEVARQINEQMERGVEPVALEWLGAWRNGGPDALAVTPSFLVMLSVPPTGRPARGTGWNCNDDIPLRGKEFFSKVQFRFIELRLEKEAA